ncbi:ADP-ribosylglycohydrolase [Oceanithermus sp.]
MKLAVVVEWSRGSRERWEWKGGRFVRKIEDQPAPVNYGFTPGLVNPADGEEVDVVVLGPPLQPKSRTKGRLQGMLWLADGDHKLVLTPDGRRHPEDEAALLDWFEPARGARLEGEDEARAWLARLSSI